MDAWEEARCVSVETFVRTPLRCCTGACRMQAAAECATQQYSGEADSGGPFANSTRYGCMRDRDASDCDV